MKHGVDLLGRDHVVLGRLLAVLGGFAEAAAGSTAAPPLANATLELLRSPQVRGGVGGGGGGGDTCMAWGERRTMVCMHATPQRGAVYGAVYAMRCDARVSVMLQDVCA